MTVFRDKKLGAAYTPENTLCMLYAGLGGCGCGCVGRGCVGEGGGGCVGRG